MTSGVGSDVSYGQFSIEHLKNMKLGIELFNQQKYWECHEELEDHWLEDTADNARYVYWAVIQVATSLFHYRQDNILGAEGMLKKAKEKLLKCESLKVETSILFDAINWDKFKKLVRDVPDKNSELSNYKSLYVFRFKPDPSLWEY